MCNFHEFARCWLNEAEVHRAVFWASFGIKHYFHIAAGCVTFTVKDQTFQSRQPEGLYQVVVRQPTGLFVRVD